MLRFKNKFRFGLSEKETPLLSSDSPRNSSESRSTLTQNASPIPDILKLTISENSKKSPSPSLNALAKVKDSASTEPSLASVSLVLAQRVASNPGLLTVKCYRSQNVQLPIDIANNKQILHALASNTNDQNTGSTLSKRLNELIQTEQAGNKSSDLIEGSSAATYLPSNITIPNATGERVTKALLYMTMEFDNNVLMIEPRGGTVDSSQWDRVVSFDVTKTVGASSTGSNFLNVSLFIRLPRNLVPEQEKDSSKHFFAKNLS